MIHRLLWHVATVAVISSGFAVPADPPGGDDSDPCAPESVVSIDDFIMWESTGTATVPVWATSPCKYARIIQYSTYDLTARAGSDYVAVRSGRVVLPAGATRTTVTVQVVRDSVPEPTEQFGIRLISGATFRDPTAVVTIRDR
jgi:hypothetical protein